jgi:hypothetical protein
VPRSLDRHESASTHHPRDVNVQHGSRLDMRKRINSRIGLALACTFIATATRAQSPGWSPGFAFPSCNALTTRLCSFDAGFGRRLYVCTLDQFQSSAPNVIRRHNGTVWENFHADVDGRVLASKVWNDGTGSALYFAGEFAHIGGIAASRIARFDGTSFAPLAGGVTGTVSALEVYDDGSGPALFAVGSITAAGGAPTNGVARWNGSSWSAIAPLPGLPFDAVSFDDGSGPALYVAGDFLGPGGTSPNVARWNGSSWSYLPTLEIGEATALCVHDDGSGPALYAANVASSQVTQVVRWSGAFWTTVGPAFNGRIFDLESTSVGGSNLVAVGEFTAIGASSVRAAARWNGSQWSGISSTFQPSSCSPTAFSAASFTPVAGPAVLVVGGCFFGSAPGAVYGPFGWDGVRVSSLFAGEGFDADVDAQTVFDDGTGPALYAGGSFTRSGGLTTQHVARWNGAMWSPVGNELGNTVLALAAFDDGSGKHLYAGGSFGVKLWNGVHWIQAGAGLGSGNTVTGFAVFDAGSGPRLYAAYFDVDIGTLQLTGHVARLDAAGWTNVGDAFDERVQSLVVHDSGTGPELYAGGTFTSCGGVSIPRVARWNGTSWTSLGSGPNAPVQTLASFDDGSGPALFVGGSFTSAGGTGAVAVAKWQSGAWSALAGGLGGTVNAFTAFDDGTTGAPALFAGGSFNAATPGGNAACIARWNGTTWSPLGVGIDGMGASVESFATFQSSWTSSPKLMIGGFFGRAGGDVAAHFAEWGPRDDGIAACFGDGVLAACPCNNASPIGTAAGCLNSTGQGGVLRTSGEARVTNDGFTLLGSTMPSSSFVIYFQGTAAVAFSAGSALDDGLGCAGGSAIRLATVQNQNGGSVLPSAQSPTPISVRGLIPPAGGTRVYQARYRDVGGPCGTLVNRSNSVIVTWRP